MKRILGLVLGCVSLTTFAANYHCTVLEFSENGAKELGNFRLDTTKGSEPQSVTLNQEGDFAACGALPAEGHTGYLFCLYADGSPQQITFRYNRQLKRPLAFKKNRTTGQIKSVPIMAVDDKSREMLFTVPAARQSLLYATTCEKN